MSVKSVLEKLLMVKSEPTMYSPLSTPPSDLSHGTPMYDGYTSASRAGNASVSFVTTPSPSQNAPLPPNVEEALRAGLDAKYSQGVKFDGGKGRISLLPGLALEQVIKVGEYGAKKYDDHNYRKGMKVTRYIDAAFRHVFIEWLFKGVDNDSESGLPHLAHGAWNILAALNQMLEKPELDDRYKG